MKTDLRLQRIALMLLALVLMMAGCGDDKPTPPEATTEWKLYKTDNSGLPINFIRCLAIDQEGRKWMGTQGGGVVVFDDKTEGWMVYTQAGYFIWDIYIDENNVVWVGSESKGLWKFDGTTWTSIPGTPDNEVWVITSDINGNLWVGTKHSGLGRYDGYAWAVYDTTNSGIPANWVFGLAVDDSTNVWVGAAWNGYTYNKGGLAKYDRNRWTLFDHHNSALDSASTVYCMAFESNGKKWFGTSKGAMLLDNGEWSLFNDPSQMIFADNAVYDLDVDVNDVKWFSMHVGGFSKFNDEWTTFDPRDYGIESFLMECLVFDDQDNTLWVGATNGLIRFREFNQE